MSSKKWVVYITKNKISKSFYIGAHFTSNPNDGYLGSGKRLQEEFESFSKAAYKKKILFVTEDFKEARNIEKKLIDRYRSNSKCLNIRSGGAGSSAGRLAKASDIANLLAVHEKIKTDDAYAEWYESKIREGYDWWLKNGGLEILREKVQPKATAAWIGKHHSSETRKKLSANHIGEQNSQYGKLWMTNGLTEKKICANELSNYIEDGWDRGRINKPPSKKIKSKKVI